MFEVQIFIPTHSNDKKKFTVAHHVAFEKAVVQIVGGITRLPVEASGRWLDNGQEYADHTRVYLLALDSLTEGSKIGPVVALAKVHYDQLKIYIRYLGVAEIL